jgi:hypothetical protein
MTRIIVIGDGDCPAHVFVIAHVAGFNRHGDTLPDRSPPGGLFAALSDPLDEFAQLLVLG